MVSSGMWSQPVLDRLRSRSVMICTPIARAPVWQYTLALAETCVLLQGLGVRFDYTSVVGSSNLPRARNVLAARFLASGATDLMFIDDDTGWDQNDVVRLLASEQPLIAGISRKKTDKSDDLSGWCCHLLPGGEIVRDEAGHVEIARAGTGFMRIQRRVLEAMMLARPEWKGGDTSDLSPDEQQFYHRFFAYDAAEQTEDYVFCDRWRELGGHVFIDPSVTLSHVGMKDYSGAIAGLIQALDRSRQFGASAASLGGAYVIGPITGAAKP